MNFKFRSLNLNFSTVNYSKIVAEERDIHNIAQTNFCYDPDLYVHSGCYAASIVLHSSVRFRSIMPLWYHFQQLSGRMYCFADMYLPHEL